MMPLSQRGILTDRPTKKLNKTASGLGEIGTKGQSVRKKREKEIEEAKEVVVEEKKNVWIPFS